MLFLLGLAALLAVIVGVVAAIAMARKQASEEAPASEPGDFVAPVSSGKYSWRSVDESAEEFRARVTRESSAAEADTKKG